MLSPLRNRFGIPGAIAVIALVFAMFGGAYAATGGLTGKQKKEVKAIAKSFQGTGPAGLQGIAGANGKDGANGTNGSNGAPGAPGKDGVSVTSEGFTGGAEPLGEPCEERGGSEFESASPESTYACNGKEGSPWTAGGVLPSNKTETGAWSVSESQYSPVSFPIPLAADVSEANAIFITEASSAGNKEKCDNGTGEAASPDNPEADPGKLCVFVLEGNAPLISLGGGGPGAGKTGAVLFWASKQAVSLGTFAVTAP